VIDIRKRRRSVQIHGVDKKVTTNVAVKGVLTGRQDSDVEAEAEVEAERERERGTIIIDVSTRTRGIEEYRRQE
jgi:hypothetical protein